MSYSSSAYCPSIAIPSIGTTRGNPASTSHLPPLHVRLVRWLASQHSSAANDGPWLSRYGIAVAALAVATVVRMLLDPLLESRAPYGCYLLAVLFVVWRAGLGPALFTVACGTLLARYFFEVPRGLLWFDSGDSQASLVMSLTIGLVATFLCESLRITARDNAHLYQLARQADARKDEFLAALAHELRNPLQPIRSATFLLGGIPEQSPQVQGLQRTIANQTDHLIRLVNDLLDVSRITQGKIELRYERIALQTVIDAAVDVIRDSVAEKRQELHISLPPGVVHLRADGVRLTQIVTNLLHNASKYTGALGRIWLTAEVESHELVIRVRDTGIGIAPDMQCRIFELFEQATDAKELASGGLGVGLTLVRSMVQLHGGSVDASSPGQGLGSNFTARLPIVAAAGSEQRPAVRRPISPCSTPLRVLVVEDSPAVALSLEVTISQWNHVVQTCSDGFAALAAVRTFKPDVVLTDLGLPRMSGYQLADELRKLPEMRHAAIIAVSGYGQEGDLNRSQEAGFARHLVKPINPVELGEFLAHYAAGKRGSF